MQRYVAKEVIHRLALIQSFMNRKLWGRLFYVCAGLCARVDSTVTGWEAHPFLGGEKWMFCWAQVNAHSRKFSALRWEEGRWKIYRVRDADKGYEQRL